MFSTPPSNRPTPSSLIPFIAFALLWMSAAGAEPNSAGTADYIATFSIVARDPATGDLGVGVQSKYFAVGSVVPHARAGVGVLATQARGNILYGPEGLDLLAAGRTPEQVLKKLLQDDPQREERQVGLVDAQGRTASYTGSKTLAWAGGRTGKTTRSRATCWPGPRWWRPWRRPSRLPRGIWPPGW